MDLHLSNEDSFNAKNEIDNESEELEGKKLDIFNNKSMDELQLKTSLNENQMYWLVHLICSIEKRRIAEVLYNLEYSIEEVGRLFQTTNDEASLIKNHFDKFGTIDIDYIVKELSDHYREKTVITVSRRMIDKGLDVDDIISVAGLLKNI